ISVLRGSPVQRNVEFSSVYAPLIVLQPADTASIGLSNVRVTLVPGTKLWPVTLVDTKVLPANEASDTPEAGLELLLQLTTPATPPTRPRKTTNRGMAPLIAPVHAA